jgi:hypothetical protein
MTWHHIIPCAVLIAVWNRLVDAHINTAVPEARTAIGQYLRLCDGGLPNLEDLVDRIRAANETQRRTIHHQLRPLDVAEANQLQTAAMWPAWNAVQGPRNRSDDPQDRYFDRFTAGLTAEEKSRMNAIEMLFGQLQTFAAIQVDPATLRALANTASIARSTLGRAVPIQYRADMWVEERDRRWRKNR